MDFLNELSSISSYQPHDGDLLFLFNMIASAENLTRKEALETFLANQKSEARFRNVHKELKDRLVGGIFTNSFPEFSTVQNAFFRIWKNEAAVKICAITAKRKILHKLGTETFHLSRKYGVFETAISMAKMLLGQHTIIDPNPKKYKFYIEAINEMEKKLQEEWQAQSLNYDIIFRIRRNLGVEGLSEKIEVLDEIAEKNNEHRFNLFYFNSKSLYYQMINDQESNILISKKAIQFFQTFDIPLPYTTSYAFYSKLAVTLINQKQFEEAERHLNQCLKLPVKGSYNWNITLFLIAILGFHSNQPQIAYEAWKKAKSQPKRVDSEVIEDRWRIVLAYLVWYKKLGRLDIEEDYKMGKFLNEIDIVGRYKTGQNVSVIVAQLIHYLVDKRIDNFEKLVSRLEKYITTYLKKKEQVRSKNFLRAMRKIEDADYYLKRTLDKTKRYWSNIENESLEVSIDLLESEVVPFELTWEEVKKLLR
jgi:tetratricopeptide (TPR) repeat protein